MLSVLLNDYIDVSVDVGHTKQALIFEKKRIVYDYVKFSKNTHKLE